MANRPAPALVLRDGDVGYGPSASTLGANRAGRAAAIAAQRWLAAAGDDGLTA